MKFFSKINRLVKMAVAAVAVVGAVLVVPGGAAHAQSATGDGGNWRRQMIANGVPGVYFFKDIYYQGQCAYSTGNDEVDLLNANWNDSFSSMKVVGSGTWDIILYKDKNLNFFTDSYHTYNSIPDFREVRMTFGANLNDQVTSFTLWYR